MSTARKILSNTVAQVIGKVFVSILGLATVKIATNYLSVEGYGEYVTIYEFLAFFGIAADMGLFTIAVKEMAEDESNIPKIIGNIISLRTILVIITMTAAIIVSLFVPKYQNTNIPLGVAVASITVFLTIMNGTTTSVLQAKLKMGIASITTVLGKATTLLFMGYIVFWGFPTDTQTGFYMLLFAGIAGSFVMVFTTDHYVKKITPLEYRFDLDLWRNVLIKSLPYGLALILNTVYFRINSVLLSFIKGQEEMGIFGVGLKILENFTILPLYFMNSVLPVLTRHIKSGSEKYKQIIKYSFDFLAALSFPMVVGGVLLAYPIIFIVSSPEFLSRVNEGFYGADISFQILIFALMFQFLNVLFAFILVAINKQSKLIYINGACVIINLVLNLFLIPKYGARGAAATSVFSELFILIVTGITARRYLKFSLNIKNLFKIIFSSLVMGVIVYYLQPITYNYMQNWNVLALVIIGALVYGLMLILTKTITKDMLRLFRKGEENAGI